MHQEGTCLARSIGPDMVLIILLTVSHCDILCKILTHDCVTMGTRGVAVYVYLLYFVLPSHIKWSTSTLLPQWSQGRTQTQTTPPDTIINGVFVLSASYPQPVWRLWIFLSWLWKENLEIVTIKRIIAGISRAANEPSQSFHNLLVENAEYRFHI